MYSNKIPNQYFKLFLDKVYLNNSKNIIKKYIEDEQSKNISKYYHCSLYLKKNKKQNKIIIKKLNFKKILNPFPRPHSHGKQLSLCSKEEPRVINNNYTLYSNKQTKKFIKLNNFIQILEHKNRLIVPLIKQSVKKYKKYYFYDNNRDKKYNCFFNNNKFCFEYYHSYHLINFLSIDDIIRGFDSDDVPKEFIINYIKKYKKENKTTYQYLRKIINLILDLKYYNFINHTLLKKLLYYLIKYKFKKTLLFLFYHKNKILIKNILKSFLPVVCEAKTSHSRSE